MERRITNQHGDLLFEEIEEIPKDAKKVKVKKGYIFERGEGIHTHVLEDVDGIEVYEKGEDIYINVKKSVRINHEEHGLQILEPGIKKKKIEREWNYELHESRKTLD